MPDHAKSTDFAQVTGAQTPAPAGSAGPVAVYLERRTCAGQRTCTTTAPTVFRYSADRDYSEVITEVVGDPAIITQVHDAEDLCPTQSIHVTS